MMFIEEKKKKNKFHMACVAVIASIAMSGFHSLTQAAPGELSNIPLSLVTSTKPNILLLLDDSGSMDSMNAITTEAQNAHGDDIDGYGTEHRAIIEVDRQLWQLCAGYNALAFNPKVKYEKWQDFIGNDFNDDQVADRGDSRAVLENPFATRGRVNLSNDIYIRWDDQDDEFKGVYNSFSSSDGECGPGVAGYDPLAQASTAFPEGNGTISLTPTVNLAAGVLTDSNANNGINYEATDKGTVTIDVAGGGDENSGDSITFEVSIFNVASASGTDSLTIYGGDDINSPISDAITVTELFDGFGGIKVPPNPYTSPNSLPRNVVSSILILDDDSYSNRTNEIKKFTIKGSKATLVFDGGNDGRSRLGFSISWRHSRATERAGDGVVTKEDCGVEDADHHCVSVASLPLTEADAIAQGKEPYNTQENYANWYTYYRKRDFVAKKALGDLVFDSDYRVGFATINDNGDGGAIIKDMENNIDGSISTDKSDLLEKIYRTRTSRNKPNSSIHTPLIKGLSNAGLYFSENKSPESGFFGTRADQVDNVYPPVSADHSDDNTVNNSPILRDAQGGQCQQNFTLVFSDGAWTDRVSLYAGTEHDTNGLDSGFVGNVDGISSGDGDNSGDGDGDFSGGVYADNLSDTLADVAMHYFINDLAPSATDSLSVRLGSDVISHQHMVTFTIAFGVNGNRDVFPNEEEEGVWPTTFVGSGADKNKIDDMLHAAFNGRGDFLSAANVQEVQTSLDKIITEIGIRTDNTAAGASFSSFELIDGEFRYDTTYNNVIWSGELESFAYNQQTNDFNDQHAWSADEKMLNRGSNRHVSTAPLGRKIITYNGSKGISFAFPDDYRNPIAETELSLIQIDDLLTNAPHLLVSGEFAGEPDNSDPNRLRNQAYGQVIVDYLRGDNRYDGASLSGEVVTLNDGLGTEVSFIVDEETEDNQFYSHSFRDRDSHYLGAFIHSEPQFVGAPNNNYPDSIEPRSPYSTFANSNIHKNRREMIYVGGNDGMLHGFYAADGDGDDDDTNGDGGEEVFAYIPQLVSNPAYGGKGLNQLALSDFNGAPYVDGSPVVADVYVNRADVGDSSTDDLYELAQWRSYLVGGLRAGGRGIYILDVTNPNSDSGTIYHPKLSDAETEGVANKIVVNEFTHPDMGYIYGKPRIGKMNNGRWAAIVGNGYNSSSTGEGTASLFIVYLDAPTETVGDDTDNDGIRNDGLGDYSIITASANTWLHCANENEECSLSETSQVRYSLADGTYKSETRTGTFTCDVETFSDLGGERVCEYSDSNGLSQPSIIDVDGNGTIDRIYAGDLHGNLWIFDAENTEASSWDLHVANTPFYTACYENLIGNVCPKSARQAITSTPLITNNPIKNDDETQPNYLVFFGTGQYVTEFDKGTDDKQSFYAIWDAGDITSGLDKSNLTSRKIVNEEIGGIATGNRTIEGKLVNYSESDSLYGWYYEYLPDEQERVVLNPLLFGDILLFQTLIPQEGICNAVAGSGYIMAVDALTGGNPSIDLFGTTADGNVAGVKLNSVIVGSNITKSDDDIEINVKTADGKITSKSLTGSGDEAKGAGDLYTLKGRKSWSILR